MKWLIVGAGVSGLGAAKLLTKNGEYVRVSESRRLRDDKAATFRELGVDLLDGVQDLSHLEAITDLVPSPGLPSTHPLLVEARARNINIISEIDLALKNFHGQLISVTGTNGKSTTCAMLAHILKSLGRSVSLGGNFGDPPSALIAERRIGDILVLELSSYQLEQSNAVKSEVAIFTSFSQDHLGRHGSMTGYLRAKWRIFDHMDKNCLAIVPHEIMTIAEKEGLTIKAQVKRIYKDRDEMHRCGLPGYVLENSSLIPLQGADIPLKSSGISERQNLLNASFALLATSHITGILLSDLVGHLKGFKPLPHRCEQLGTIKGRTIINDSKSTNVESTLVALDSQNSKVILMMGGQGKGESYAPIAGASAALEAVVVFGASASNIAKDLASQNSSFPLYEYPSLKAAMDDLERILDRHTGTLLFSPGCASFDEFENYEARGDFFKKQLSGKLDSKPGH